MNLHDDLLDQAQQLARWDPRRPKQVNLRRAVSSAYYALFHLLSSGTSALYAIEPDLAARINRTLNHGDMKKSSTMIGNDKLPRAVQSPRGSYTTPADLKTVANTFVKLQEARHEADYDLSRTFRRQEVLAYVQTGAPGVRGMGADPEDGRRPALPGELPPLETLGRGPALTGAGRGLTDRNGGAARFDGPAPASAGRPSGPVRRPDSPRGRSGRPGRRAPGRPRPPDPGDPPRGPTGPMSVPDRVAGRFGPPDTIRFISSRSDCGQPA